MLGADIVTFSAQSNKLVDSYVLGESATPRTDVCQSWTLINSSIGRDFIVFQATRLLDSGDSQDRIFSNDSDPLLPATRVIAAWGDSPEPSYHGGKIARNAIRFFGHTGSSEQAMSFEARMESEAQGNFTLLAKDFIIPTERSTFELFCFTRDELLANGVPLDQPLHLIGFEPVIDPRAKRNVHHFTLLGTPALDCSLSSVMSADFLYAWAPGVLPMDLPSNVGSPMGLSSMQTFFLDFHYDNAAGASNITDASGIRLFYTAREKREFDLGIFNIAGGPPFILSDDNLLGVEPILVSATPGLSQHVLDCWEGCSQRYVTRPVTVIKQFFHMHWTGVSASSMQIRNGEVVRQNEVQFWDFSQQGDFAAPQPAFEVLPGDNFRIICNYNALHNETWGDASNNEMCQVYYYYYPRQVQNDTEWSCGTGLEEIVPDCGADYTLTPDFRMTEQLGRTFGLAPGTCLDAPTLLDLETNDQSAGVSTRLWRGILVGVVAQILL